MIVIDHTVLIPLLFRTSTRLAAVRVAQIDSVWVVPSQWRLDLINHLIEFVRAGNANLEDSQTNILAAAMLIRESHEVLSSSELFESGVQLGITATQATYILTARRLGAQFVTDDPQILTACPDDAVSIETFGAN